jgi:hypothetical protein
MTALVLQGDHQVRKILDRNFTPLFIVTNIVILTEHTAEVTMGEKDRARTIMAHKGRLLAKMGKGAGDDKLFSCLADTEFALQAIGFALSGTEGTGFKDGVKLSDAIL